MSQLRVVMTGEEAQLFNALQNVIAQSKKADDAFESNQSSSGEAEKAAIAAAKAQAKAAREGARLADRLAKKNETLEESYKRREAQIEAAGKAGIKSEEEVRKAISQLRQDVDAQAQAEADAALKSTQAYRDKQAQIQRGVEKVGQLIRANQSLESQYREMKSSIRAAFDAGKIGADEYNDSLNRLQGEYDDLRRKQKTSFGASAQSEVQSFAASFLSVSAAINVVREALEYFNREKERALGSTNSLDESRTRLLQVAGGDADEFQRLVDLADKAAIAGGFSREKGAELVFAAKSAGVEDKAEFIAKGNSFVSAEAQVELLGKTQKLFQNQLSDRQLINATAAAASESLLNVEAIIAQTPKLGGKAQGIDAVEQLALLSLGTDETESADKTSNLLKTFFLKAARRKEFAGMDTFQIVDEIERLESDGDKKNDFIKDSDELFQANQLLKNIRSEFAQREQLIQSAVDSTGTENDIRTRSILARFSTDTAIGRLSRANLEANRQQIVEEKSNEFARGERAAIQKAQKARAMAGVNGVADSALLRFGVSKGIDLIQTLGIDGADIQKEQSRFRREELEILRSIDANTKGNNQPLSIPTEDK